MDRNHLILEYQALANETKRKHPEVREAAEKAINILRPLQVDIRTDSRLSDDILFPILLGCKTKNPKVVATAIGALQRLIGLGGLPERLVPSALQVLGEALTAGLDSQLKILQVLLFVLKYCEGIHGDLLGQVLLLCFRLHDSKVGIVSSTAAATLRQGFMMVFERLSSQPPATVPSLESNSSPVATDDSNNVSTSTSGPAGLPESAVHDLTPDASDAFWIFQDLCTLLSPPEVRKHQRQNSMVGSGKKQGSGTTILNLKELSKTFGLELVESILNGFSSEIRQRVELLAVLRNSLCSLLAQSINPNLDFAVTLRLVRLQFLIIRSYSQELPQETEVFMNTLINLAAGDTGNRKGSVTGGGGSAIDGVPYWLRVMSMEALLGLFQSSSLLEHVWAAYDAVENHSDILTKLINTLNRILSERPGQLGTYPGMQGLHITSYHSNTNLSVAAQIPGRDESYLDKGFSAMATAATMGVNTVSAMMAGDQMGGLDSATTAMKVQCIEQHDKSEPPVIPEKNIYLLAVRTFVKLAVNIAALSTNSPEASISIINSCWTAFLATYSLLFNANLSSDLFFDCLESLRSMMCGVAQLQLTTPREAFITSLGRFAVPPPLLNALQQYQDASNQRSSISTADALGFGGSVSSPPRPSLSERNLACLKTLLDVIELTQNNIGPSWNRVIPILQDANYVLHPSYKDNSNVPGTPPLPGTPLRSAMNLPHGKFSAPAENSDQLALESLAGRLERVFDRTTLLSDESLQDLLRAICKCNLDLIHLNLKPSSDVLTPGSPRFTPRRDSFDISSRTNNTGSIGTKAYRMHKSQFCVSLLDKIVKANLDRVISNQDTWRLVVSHLFDIVSDPELQVEARIQAVQVILNMVEDVITSKEEPPQGPEIEAQGRVLEALTRLITADPTTNDVYIDPEMRLLSVESLNRILEYAGHNLVNVWSILFSALEQVCRKDATRTASGLVRAGFVGLNLICNDFASTLSAPDWSPCISCLSTFGRQRVDVNVSLSAIGLMWQMADLLRNDVKEQDTPATALLISLSKMCTDDRAEVRMSALQTLFRCIASFQGGSIGNKVNDIVFALLQDFDRKANLSRRKVDAGMPDWDDTGHTIVSEVQGLLGTQSFCTKSEDIDRLLSYTIKWSKQAGTKICTACLELETLLLEKHADSGPAGARAFAEVYGMLKAQSTDFSLDQSVQAGFFTQQNLKALLGLAGIIGKSYDMTEVLECIVATVQYRLSPVYTADVDSLTAVQQVALDLLSALSQKADLVALLEAEVQLGGLAFGHGFQFADMSMQFGPSNRKTIKDVTFVGLHKAVLPMLMELVATHAGVVLRDTSGLLERLTKVLLNPLKLGESCPAANKYGDDPPLQVTAKYRLVELLTATLPIAAIEGEALTSDRHQEIWRLAMSSLERLLPSDKSSIKGKAKAEETTTTTQEQEQAVVHLLRRVMLPNIGYKQLPDAVIEEFATLLQQRSVMWLHDGSNAWDMTTTAKKMRGTCAPSIALPGEAVRVRCLDLLFTGVDGSATDARVKRIFDPFLASRCQSAISFNLADLSIRGRMPLERIRELELVTILQRVTQADQVNWPWLPPLLIKMIALKECNLPQVFVSPEDPLLQRPGSELVLLESIPVTEQEVRIKLQAKELAMQILER